MANQRRITGVLMVAALVMVMGYAAEAAARVTGPRVRHRHRQWGFADFEFVIEGGLAQPTGDVSDDLDFYGPGKGADTGYEVGARFRQYLTPQFAIAPAFHYVDFGKTTGLGYFDEGDALGYEVETSLLRYGLDFQYFMDPAGRSVVQPYLTAGLGLIHNRYRDGLEYYGDYEASANALGVSLGAGLQIANFELSAVYTFDRFSSSEMSADYDEIDYNWDYLSVRMGLAFGGY